MSRIKYLQPVATVLLVTTLSSTPAWADERREQALELSKRGLDAYLAGEFAKAESLYAQAYKLAPEEPLYLYNAARAAERAGHLDTAERMYQLYLSQAPAGQPEIAKARFHVAELQAARKAGAAGPAARSQDGASRGAIGLGILITGGVAAVGGGILLGTAAADQSTLNTRLGQRDQAGNITGISHADAVAEQNGINTREYIGWGMVGAGVLAAVGGGVLMATAPGRKLSLGPGPGGLGIQAAWKF